MPWFAIYETATGRLRSLATIRTDPLKAGLASIEFADRPDDSANMWDRATLSFVPRPPKILADRFDDDLLTHPKFKGFREVYDSLSNPDQNKIRKVIRTLLGTELKRNVNESEEIGGDDA